MSPTAHTIGLLGLGLALVGGSHFFARAAPAPAPTELALTVNEYLEFTPGELRCRAGSPVRLRITHLLPAGGPDMPHTAVLLTRTADVAAFSEAVLHASAEDHYVPPAFRKHVLAATVVIHAGEKTELRFTAPTERGTYPLVCSFPGHCLMGMKATLTVE